MRVKTGQYPLSYGLRLRLRYGLRICRLRGYVTLRGSLEPVTRNHLRNSSRGIRFAILGLQRLGAFCQHFVEDRHGVAVGGLGDVLLDEVDQLEGHLAIHPAWQWARVESEKLGRLRSAVLHA